MTYVTSDLHGCPLQKVKALLKRVQFSKADSLFILGDVIDRGKDGIRILRWLMAQPNVRLILGNHEAMLLENQFLFEPIPDAGGQVVGTDMDTYLNWIFNGGQPTVEALTHTGKRTLRRILRYLRNAPLYETLTVNGTRFILTHAGLGNFHPAKQMRDYTPDELLWNRPALTDRYFDNGAITIFGHTPTIYYGHEYKEKILRTETWIDIDIGVAAGADPVLLRLEDGKVFFLSDSPTVEDGETEFSIVP